MLHRLVTLSVVLWLSGCGARSSLPSPPRSTPPSARDVFAALAAHRDLVPSHPSCTSVTGDPTDTTIGAIEAHLLGQLAEALRGGDPAVLTASCDGVAPWQCTFEVSIPIEDPWRYGITFTLRADGSIDPATLRCPGTG